MATKGESAKTKFAGLYKDDQTAEVGDPDAGLEDEEQEGDGGHYEIGECIADIESALSRLKAKVGK